MVTRNILSNTNTTHGVVFESSRENNKIGSMIMVDRSIWRQKIWTHEVGWHLPCTSAIGCRLSWVLPLKRTCIKTIRHNPRATAPQFRAGGGWQTWSGTPLFVVAEHDWFRSCPRKNPDTNNRKQQRQAQLQAIIAAAHTWGSSLVLS